MFNWSKVSLILKLNKEGDLIQEPELFQSIIKVKCNLNYDQFDKLLNISNSSNIDEKNLNSWNSYGTKATHYTGILKDITISQLKQDIQNLEYIFNLKLGTKNEEMPNGKFLISDLGKFLGNYIGNFLYRMYGEYALASFKNGNIFTSFRSPLRKFYDCCVLKQIISAMNSEDLNTMASNFFGFSLSSFKEFVDYSKKALL